jgi:hypothetical protein
MRRLHYIPNCSHELFDLLTRHYQWWSHLQNHEVVSADLRQNPMIAEHPHHNDLPEHRGMNVHEGFEWNPQP